LLPFAAAPAAMAGIAAAFAFGNTPAAAPRPAAVGADASGHPTATAAAPREDGSATQIVSITQAPASGVPIVRLDASRLAAAEPKGKHHRAASAEYVVKSGDTLASIAAHLYSSADYWPVLYWANHAKIQYANEIQVGQVLAVPAKPAKVPAAPTELSSAPAPAPAAAPVTASSAASSGGSYSSTGTTQQAAPVQTVSTYSGSTGSFQACVISRESGGNPQVTNGSGHYGLYQFSASTWAAYGGNAADFGNASVAEQNQVFANAMAAGGQSNWAPYDGC
jgi:LysM repeat protein